jgi:translation initiation factor 1
MAEICSKCGLPEDLCVCEAISREQQRIKLYLEKRKWRRYVTIIEGIDQKDQDIRRLTSKLKTVCACGGAVKSNKIILQGDQRDKARDLLTKSGFPVENIEVI